MANAFHSDEQLKNNLLTVIDRHTADATLKIGATYWDGVSGSPLGISIHGTDANEYSDRFGYPVALAALLDPLTSKLGENDYAIGFARSWVKVVTPGADLTFTASDVLELFLSKSGAVRTYPDFVHRLMDLQRGCLGGATIERSSWSDLRDAITQQLVAPENNRKRLHLMLLEAASWPLRTSQSVLPEIVRLWIDFGDSGPVPNWDFKLAKRLHDLLGELYPEARQLSNDGVRVTGEDLLHQRYPELAAKGDEMLAAKAKVEQDHCENCAAIVLGALEKAK